MEEPQILNITDPLTPEEMVALLSAAWTVVNIYEHTDETLDTPEGLGGEEGWITHLKSAIQKLNVSETVQH